LVRHKAATVAADVPPAIFSTADHLRSSRSCRCVYPIFPVEAAVPAPFAIGEIIDWKV
jgi:hypothetical protein